MRDCDPLVIWETLAKVHRARGLATRLALRRKLLSSMKEGESMQSWVGRVKSVVWDLEEIGVKVDDEDIILALTMGLDSSYDSFVISLDSTPSSGLTLKFVINRLLNEDARWGGRDEAIKAENTVFLTWTAAAGTGGAQSHSCWCCGKVGHIRAFCTEKPMKRAEDSQQEESAHLVKAADCYIFPYTLHRPPNPISL
ncbi:hypothetical protein M0805_004751 [Coniferiporia weirii]|nr:hypothetical protein M0805_004751 [Coniferiporia weirii]